MYDASRNECPCCGGPAMRPLADLGRVVRSGILLSSPQQTAPKLHLAFVYCDTCGYVRQEGGDAEPFDYSDIDRRTDRQLPRYVDQLIAGLLERTDKSALVVEVGANDGTFLDRVRDAGYSARLGVEPSRALAAMCAARGHPTENTHLSLETSDKVRDQKGVAGAVVFRHTLEHVPDPLAILLAIAKLLAPGGVLLLEVPNSEEIFLRHKFHEFWDEHVSYFCKSNLGNLLARAGFEIELISVQPHLDSSNLVVWARHRGGQPTNDIPGGRLILQHLHGLASELFRARVRFRSVLETSQKPIAVLGASHPQTNLIKFFDVGQYVEVFIDDDPSKAGRYVPVPNPKRVVTTSEFVETFRFGSVVLSAFGYPAWVRRVRVAFAGKEVNFLDPAGI